MSDAHDPTGLSDDELAHELVEVARAREALKPVLSFRSLSGERAKAADTDHSLRVKQDELKEEQRGRRSRSLARAQQDADAAHRRGEELREARRQAELAQAESATFWFRRFFTSLGIANAGAFAALASGLLQADSPQKIAPLLAPSMTHFAVGLLSAGAIPLLLWGRYSTRDALTENPDVVDLLHRIRVTVLQSLGISLRIAVALAAAFGVFEFANGLFTALATMRAMN